MVICFSEVRQVIKKLSKILLIIIGIILLLVAGFVLWLSINEFNPEPVTNVDIEVNSRVGKISPYEGQTISLVSWNIGYGGLGKDADFFMDGGEDVVSYDRNGVTSNLVGIYKTLFEDDSSASIFMLQEVDKDSGRTYGIDECQYLGIYNSAYTMNYSCPYVPFPLPPIGKVNSGLLTTSLYEIDHADRISLPCPFSWPVSTANLKRCLLVSYIPVQDSDRQLVIVNLHLEAYDDGEGKIAQTKQLREFIQAEYEKGNYVIAGGDFNQIFPGGLDKYPNEHTDLWEPGIISEDIMPDGWTLAYDAQTPTCRLLNQAYDPDDADDTQYYVIDGFILSPNVKLNSVNTLDEGFTYSDHNPVRLEVTLKY